MTKLKKLISVALEQLIEGADIGILKMGMEVQITFSQGPRKGKSASFKVVKVLSGEATQQSVVVETSDFKGMDSTVGLHQRTNGSWWVGSGTSGKNWNVTLQKNGGG